MRRPLDLLLEIGTEELPPADVRPALEQLKAGVRNALHELRIDVGQIETYGTPRRLVVSCTEVGVRQQPVVRRVKGPAAHVAYDSEGRPTPAATGFARSQGIPVGALSVETIGSGRYVIATVEEAGQPTASVLPPALRQVIGSITFPKTMRWESSGTRFARPVRWIVALLGSRVLPLNFAGVRAGRKTYGHRVLHPKAMSVKSPQDYFSMLRRSHVILDPEDRQARITADSNALAATVRARPQLDANLVEETVMTTEHPVVLRGTFSLEFLSLPPEVLVTVMEHHQKYFPVVDTNGRLQPYFIAVRDGGDQHLATVREGHEWVLRARFADARFFFEADRKRRLEEYVSTLEGLIVQAQLGSMADKTGRLGRLAAHVADALGLNHSERTKLQRAALLAKADLVTHLVGEFPELQGIVGGIYAALDREPPDVADAIREHYHPAGAGDPPPGSRLGALLAVIDRVDTIVGALAAGLAPTGSQDPYGLRRAVQGIVEIVLTHELAMPLRPLIQASAASYEKADPTLVEQVEEFIRQRLRSQLVDQGLRYDLVDAALAVSGDALLEGAKRASGLQVFAARPEFVRLYVAFDRASRIVGEKSVGTPNASLFEVEAERVLHRLATAVGDRVRAALAAGNYAQALESLVPLADPIDKLFEDVLIMAPDLKVQDNRLALLGEVASCFRTVADFSKVVMSDEATREPTKARQSAPHVRSS